MCVKSVRRGYYNAKTDTGLLMNSIPIFHAYLNPIQKIMSAITFDSGFGIQCHAAFSSSTVLLKDSAASMTVQ